VDAKGWEIKMNIWIEARVYRGRRIPAQGWEPMSEQPSIGRGEEIQRKQDRNVTRSVIRIGGKLAVGLKGAGANFSHQLRWR